MKTEQKLELCCHKPRNQGHQDLGERYEAISLITLRRNQLCQHLDFRLLASRTVRQYTSLVSSTQPVVPYYCSPRKLLPEANFSEHSSQCPMNNEVFQSDCGDRHYSQFSRRPEQYCYHKSFDLVLSIALGSFLLCTC